MHSWDLFFKAYPNAIIFLDVIKVVGLGWVILLWVLSIDSVLLTYVLIEFDDDTSWIQKWW